MKCGPNGHCEDGACTCDTGWEGDSCSTRTCDARCSGHGECNNGTCVCMPGWNGIHCTLEGCPGSPVCMEHGQCRVEEGLWKCRCDKGWEGVGCETKLEANCRDGRDNDGGK